MSLESGAFGALTNTHSKECTFVAQAAFMGVNSNNNKDLNRIQ
jgi:hypothetical protein